ncbi:alpha/beta hydrolase fold protein [Thecamonas trahens ATCC 50062]|uniref:Alpha/beta hydrolase fold protein n=1 Tax=Thecamonas trahens ATCC 50062 TaxID=461836 RepID=A0A0L0DER2_THETB|nr:alpha/beta hydrolase fold protein [Thecamonas trahens ATCC 50062]KNC50822.1 alpha/beta hydrolase fold protein [Thecamonas trahens ATCC 50062]|eukprot:XP_013756777.1 alpha/beta hydrolase fold protein [Thecamonas trahens ATCC 50062]
MSPPASKPSHALAGASAAITGYTGSQGAKYDGGCARCTLASTATPGRQAAAEVMAVVAVVDLAECGVFGRRIAAFGGSARPALTVIDWHLTHMFRLRCVTRSTGLAAFGQKLAQISRASIGNSAVRTMSSEVGGAGGAAEAVEAVPFEASLPWALTIAGKEWRRPGCDEPRSRVLALHGWCDSAASYDKLAPLLVTAPGGPDSVLAIDLPGHGLSSWRAPDANYHYVDYVHDVMGLMVQEGLLHDPHTARVSPAAGDADGTDKPPHITLMGHSMGGGIAVMLAGAWPHAIDRLVLIEGAGTLPATTDADQVDVVASFVASKLKYASAKSAPRPHPRRDAMAERLVQALRGKGAMDLDAARTLVARGTRQLPSGEFTWRSDPRLRMAAPYRISEPSLRAFLGNIAAPAVLVMASRGWPIPDELVAERLAAVPHLQAVRLDGSHHLHLEVAETLADLFVPFIAEDSGVEEPQVAAQVIADAMATPRLAASAATAAAAAASSD